MSLTLTQSPNLHSFSKELISAKFFSDSYLLQVGAKAVNRLYFSGFPANTQYFTLKYGSQSIKITAVTTPDDSGLQIPAGQSSVLPILAALQKNYILNRDFILYDLGDTIVFEAKEVGAGYNMTMGLSTATSANIYGPTVEGLNEIIKPNYTVLFSLFLENASNTGFDLIYTTNLQLRFDQPGVTIAQIGDKMHQKIASDLDLLGLEIPTTTALACKTTCRRYYFQYAESFGEPIAVQKVTTSSTYNVIYGGLSYQAQTNSTVSTLLNGATKRFLKQGANSQFIRLDQPQFLYYYHFGATQATAKLKAKRYFDDLTNDTVDVYSVNLVQYRKYAFNINCATIYAGAKTLVKYEIYLVDNGATTITEVQTYTVDRLYKNFVRYFLNYSSWGSLDCRTTTGKFLNELEITADSATRNLQAGYNLQQCEIVSFNKKIMQKFKATSGFIGATAVNAYKDFFLSEIIYRVANGDLLPIQITNTSTDLFTDGLFQYAVNFEYQYAFADHAYSENDN